MALGAAAFGLAAAQAAHAGIVNPSFEESPDFNGYVIIGNDTIMASDFRVPADGLLQAVLSTGPQGTTGGPANPATAASLESFLGMSSGSLTGLGATEGSAIKQTITTATTGDTLTFKYDFATNEKPGVILVNGVAQGVAVGSFNDFGFLTINGVLTKLADTNSTLGPPPAITLGGDNAGINSFLSETGYQMFTLTLGGPGTYTIGFGVADVGDTTTDSVLLVDNLGLRPGQSGGGGGGVPLPAGMYLMPLGLALAGLYSGKLRRVMAC
jgi:hypothetical protein